MNVLIVSPGFIPSATVGKMRMVSLSKYLMQFDTVTVIQNKISSYSQITNEKPIKDIKIIEADVGGTFSHDAKAYKRALNEVDLTLYDIVIISVGPYYTLPLVNEIKRKSDIPIIIDYRDLWTRPYRDNDTQSKLKEYVKSFFYEKPALRKADGITICDEKSLQALKEQYHFLEKIKSKVVYNGYDDTALKDIKLREHINDNGTITIGIYGKFGVYVKNSHLSWIVKELGGFWKSKNMHLKIIQYGNRETEMEKLYFENDIDYEYRGFVEYSKGMQALADEADLLMASNDVIMGYGTKIFDYIFLNKPVIMHVIPESTLDTFVNSFDYGYGFFTREELRTALNDIYNSQAKKLGDNIDYKKYGRRMQNTIFREFIKEFI